MVGGCEALTGQFSVKGDQLHPNPMNPESGGVFPIPPTRSSAYSQKQCRGKKGTDSSLRGLTSTGPRALLSLLLLSELGCLPTGSLCGQTHTTAVNPLAQSALLKCQLAFSFLPYLLRSHQRGTTADTSFSVIGYV